MSPKCKFVYICVFFINFLTFSSSTPTTTQPEPEESPTTESSASFNDLPLETAPINTNAIYQMNLTTTGSFNSNFDNKNSKIFAEFSSNLDAELIYVIESALDRTISLGAFKVTQILPSNLENHLFLTILVKVSDDEAEKWENAIKARIEENGKLVEIGVKIQGFGWAKMSDEELPCCCAGERNFI